MIAKGNNTTSNGINFFTMDDLMQF